MSKTTCNEIDLREFWALFYAIMCANGWKVTISHQDALDGELSLRLLAEKKLSWRKQVKLTLIAWGSETESVLFVHRFRVAWCGKKAVPVSGESTLRYHGKEPCEDVYGAQKGRHWVLRSPVDILALFEAHDRIAGAVGDIKILK